MADAATIASLATAGGTLVLAVATFSATRSANRAARASERSLQVGLRPVLMSARPTDPPEKVPFGGGRWLRLTDGMASAGDFDDGLYLAAPLRNVAAGLAVLHSWEVVAGHLAPGTEAPDPGPFRRLQRDLYVPAGDTGYWQGAIRDRSDPLYEPLQECLREGRNFTLHILYGDHEGGQRTITRIVLSPRTSGDGADQREGTSQWFCAVVRHWNLDRLDPR
jgi:hypothetical protein